MIAIFRAGRVVTLAPREKRVLLVGGLLGAAIVAAVYVVAPLVSYQRTIREETRAKRTVFERYQLVASQRGRYRQKMEGLRAQMRQADELLFSGEKLPVLAASLQGLLHGLGQETGVTIVRENVPPPRKVETFNQVTVELSVKGDLGALRDFLYKIQTSPKLLTVPKLTIRGLSLPGQTALSADLQVAGYTLRGAD